METISILLNRSWWALLIRGILIIIFGIAALSVPELTAGLLAVFFGVLAVLDGIIIITESLLNRFERWGVMLVAGLLSVIAGGLAILWPGMIVIVILYIIAIRSMLVGIMEIITAIRLRKLVDNEWMMILAGLISIIFAAVIFLHPEIAIEALILMMGLFALFLGVIMLILAFKAKEMAKDLQNAGS